jgi:uncharacterized Tic20 family protein
MTQIKKNSLCFVFFSLLPLLIVWSTVLFENLIPGFNGKNYQIIFVPLEIISILSSVLVLFRNYISKVNNVLLYLLSSVTLIISCIFFWLAISFKFGY